MQNQTYLNLVYGFLLTLFFTIFLAGCVTGNGQQEYAGNYTDDSELQSLVINLIEWIGENSDYEVEPYLSKPPEISFCRRKAIIEYEEQTIIMHDPVKGVYDLKRARITLVEPFSLHNPDNVSTLLHELVHFVQYSSRQWDCWHETEWDAYKLQELWLNQHGIDPGFNWVEIFLLSRCSRRDIHM